jgi:hypothetical protein
MGIVQGECLLETDGYTSRPHRYGAVGADPLYRRDRPDLGTAHETLTTLGEGVFGRTRLICSMVGWLTNRGTCFTYFR